jgi:hypothetical protein
MSDSDSDTSGGELVRLNRHQELATIPTPADIQRWANVLTDDNPVWTDMRPVWMSLVPLPRSLFY